MSSIVVLVNVELIPVLELMPMTFAAQARSSPIGGSQEAWHQYWSDALADSGLTGLMPVRRGSWHVPTTEFADQTILQKLLAAIFHEWGGIGALSDPDGKPVLNGGLALRCTTPDVLIEPGCCADLGDVANWMEAANYRQADWHMLWIGHPWLSVKYEAPWLIISDQHESENPTARWAICPDELHRAVVAAKAEMDRFARQIAVVLAILGCQGDTHLMGRKLAGIIV
jgi:hypothetical protein